MPLIQWSDKYNVGVATLDGQHRKLINMINELHEAMSQGHAKELQAGLLQRVGQYAAEHLNTEEKMLKASGYPGFAQHKAQHDNYIAKMHEFEKKLGAGGVSPGHHAAAVSKRLVDGPHFEDRPAVYGVLQREGRVVKALRESYAPQRSPRLPAERPVMI